MTETLLLALLVSLWILLRPKRDWYVVEWRTCDDEALSQTAFDATMELGFSKPALAVLELSIENKLTTSATIKHKGGGCIQILQTVFEDLDAAMQHFERTKEVFPLGEAFEKVYLWRVVATSRKKAVVLPPEKCSARDSEVILAFPPHRWFKPAKDE